MPHVLSLSNSKNTNHKDISLTGTDHSNSRFFKNVQLERQNLFFFFVFQYSRKCARKTKSKGRTLKGVQICFNIHKIIMKKTCKIDQTKKFYLVKVFVPMKFGR